MDVGTDVGGLAGVGVPVGDTVTTEVAVISAAEVAVGDELGSAVEGVDTLEAEVCVADRNGGEVTVSVSGVDVPVEDAIGAITVLVAAG